MQDSLFQSASKIVLPVRTFPSECTVSKLIEKLEDRSEPRIGPWYERHKMKLPLYTAAGLVGRYFYGMSFNSLRLGTAATFHKAGEEVAKSIWVFDPFRNWLVVLTPFGLGVTAVIALLVCLITRKEMDGFLEVDAVSEVRNGRISWPPLTRRCIWDAMI